MKIGELTEQDLPALAGLYRQFRGEESSLDEMRETFRISTPAGERTYLRRCHLIILRLRPKAMRWLWRIRIDE